MYGRNLIDHKLREKHNGLIPESTNIPKMVRKLQDKINCYWSSFAKCYLNELRQFHIYRSKRQSGSSCELEMGDIVLIKEDFKVPQNVWKLGKVVELVKGRDGKTRGAKLLTVSNSGLQQNCYRPVQKLIPFEIVKSNKVNPNENHDERHCNNEIPARRAAVEGQQLRKIRDLYYY